MADEVGQAQDLAPEGRSLQKTSSKAGAASPAAASSISIAIVTVGTGDRIHSLLDKLGAARRHDDDIILVVREDQAHTFRHRPSWARLVAIPHASIFRLRAQVPAVCRNEWVIVLEDHSLIEPSCVDAIRHLIRTRPDINIIPFLTKNLTSTRPWDWAIFLFNFALVWAPLDRPPPFSIVTSGIVRRGALGTDAPLRDGEWELRTIPRLFSTGRSDYSNDIFIDHVKPLNMIPALALIFHNARAGASLQRSFGFSSNSVLWEGWYTFGPRPRMLMDAVAARRHELPPGTRLRLHALGLSHLVGNIAGVLFGGGNSAYKLD